jgi:diadenosine tetraphosphate (Ap4A) HIT family hydrolase
MNNGAAAGQVVFHGHLHIIPYPNAVEEIVVREDYAQGERHEYVEKIKSAL